MSRKCNGYRLDIHAVSGLYNYVSAIRYSFVRSDEEEEEEDNADRHEIKNRIAYFLCPKMVSWQQSKAKQSKAKQIKVVIILTRNENFFYQNNNNKKKKNGRARVDLL